MKSHVAIIGAGPIGRAIEKLLHDAGCATSICDKDPAKASVCVPTDVAVPRADIVFLCVPSWSMRDAAGLVAQHLRPGAIVVSIAKGAEEGTGKFMPDVLRETLPEGHPIAVMCGPMLASEIMEGLASGATIGTADRATYDAVVDAFRGSRIVLQHSTDVKGVAVAAVLKNVYAVGIGILSVMALGKNCKGLYVEAALRECKDIVTRFGGQPESVDSLAGIGDLIATGFSDRSMNRTAGEQIARTGSCNVRAEGVGSLPIVVRALGDISKYHVLEALNGVVAGNRNARAEFSYLFYAQ
jgi:glycerol-3-phosphate dehydrogenase (NAD(P)+)